MFVACAMEGWAGIAAWNRQNRNQITKPRRQRPFVAKCFLRLDRALNRPARDGGHKQNFVAFLEGVCLSAQEANVFLIHVDVEKPSNLSLVVAQMRLQFGEFFVENGE
jgi:hypothetical protein